LPRLTDSSAVAQWRAAAAGGVAAPAMADAASASSITLGTSPTAASALLTISAAQSHQAGLQAFLVQRFGWQPG
jgi:hypothetical protein